MPRSPLDRLPEVRERGRTSLSFRWARLRSKQFMVAQCAVAGGVAWFITADVLGHPTPFFAPIAAVVGLGTSYGQRLRRVAEITAGVAIGVLLADLLVLRLGSGWWQMTLVIALAMGVALLLDGGALFVTQAAVQSIVITALVADPATAFTRWLDVLVGGGVALVAATVVPSAPLRRPRENAAAVAAKIAGLLRAAADVLRDGETEQALDLLADARGTDHLVRELQSAADEGMSVVASSPFRVRHRGHVRRMADLVDPLDRALRTTRVLVRQCAVSAHHDQPVPESYVGLTQRLADAVDVVVVELQANRLPEAARPALLAVGDATGAVERSDLLVADAVLAQLRSLVVDFLLLSGLDQLESTAALPPPP